ncbi:MAG TPA: PAS domain S-box protein, partial [Terriglobales bacterium]|nr:PAS domain S-box protein [Terriglobales bacterium]
MISDKRFRALIENSSDAIALFSADATFLYVSPSTERILGYRPDELVGTSGFDVIHPDDVDKATKLLLAAMQSPGKTVRDELRCRHRDGSWRWIDLLGNNLIHEPDVQAIVGNYRDITEEKAAQEIARRDEARLRLLTDALPVLISYIDREQRYRFHNRQYEAWFGAAANDMDGKRVREVVGESAYANIQPHLEQALAGQTVSYEDWVPYAIKGTRYIRATYVPDIDSKGEVSGLFALVIDATEEKVADQRLSLAL